MSKDCIHLYTISFTVGAESGIALVAATDERTAIQILKSSGSRSCAEPGYTVIQIRNLGLSSSCTFGLLMESFVNAREAYEAIISMADKMLKGEKGDSIWMEMYVDQDLYLHVLESEHNISQRLSFDESTGYLTIN